MTYAATWTNGNAQGILDAGVHLIRLADASQVAEAINRRRLLTYQQEQDFSSHIHAGAPVRAGTVDAASAPPFDNLRTSLAEIILSPPTGTMGGDPATPSAMEWLWPEADDEEDKVIVSGAEGVGEGEVGLFQKLSGADGWTDAALSAGATAVRAVHFNELRRAAEWIRRGRWELPLYLTAGIFSVLPDTPWTGELIANNGTDEVRAVGFAVIRTQDDPQRGLTGVTVRASSRLELTADTDCTIDVHHCLRDIDFSGDPPTWNEYAPSVEAAWSQAGGLGAGDSSYIDSLALTADEPESLTGEDLAAALQDMIDGAAESFLLRRADTGPESVAVTGRILIEFELDSPPN